MALSSWLTALFLSAAFAGSLWRLPVLHPVTLWSGSWAAVAFLFALDLLPYHPLSAATVALICGATVMFAAGAMVGERAMGSFADGLKLSSGRPYDDHDAAITGAALTAAVIAGVMLVAFVAQGIATYGARDTLFVSADFRQALGAGALALTIKYLYFSIATAVLSALAAGREASLAARRSWLLLSAAAAGSLYFSTGRGNILLAAVMATFAYWLGRGWVPSKRRLLASVGVLAVLAIGLMTSIGELQGKTYEHSTLRGIPSEFSEREPIQPLALPYLYGSGAFAGLNEQVSVSTTWGTTQGCATASIICSALSGAGLDVEPEPFTRSNTGPPLRWNIFSSLNLPLLDGGFALSLPIVALLGFAFGLLWWSAGRGWSSALLAYAIAGGALVFSGNYALFVYPQGLGPAVIAVGLLVAWKLGLAFLRRSPLPRGAPS